MEQGDIKTYKIEVHFDNLCPGSVQNEELGGAAELQGVGHHPGPLRGRVLLLVRQGPDDAGAGVWVTGHVERPRHHRRHLQQPQRSVVTSQPSTTRIYPVTNVMSPMQAPTTTSTPTSPPWSTTGAWRTTMTGTAPTRWSGAASSSSGIRTTRLWWLSGMPACFTVLTCLA